MPDGRPRAEGQEVVAASALDGRRSAAKASALAVAGGGVSAACAWGLIIVADAFTPAAAALAIASLVLCLGLASAAVTVARDRFGRVALAAGALLLLLGVASFFAVLLTLVLAPVGVAFVAAWGFRSGRLQAVGAWLLIASFFAYAVMGIILEAVRREGEYGVIAFVPLLALAWIAIAAGIWRDAPAALPKQR